MRRALSVIFLSFTISACSTPVANQYLIDREACETADVPETNMLSDDGEMSMEYRVASDTCRPFERGIYDGVPYRADHHEAKVVLYTSDSKHMAWSATCVIDPVTDEKSARIQNERILLVRSADIEFFGAIARRYPGTETVLRVDNHPADIVEREHPLPGVSSRVIKKMLDGEKILLRYVVWPDGVNADLVYDLWGFRQAYKISDRCL